MHEVSTFRLYLLRATYLLILVGLGLMVWPRLAGHSHQQALLYGDTWALLGGVSLMALIGLRHPVRMIPLLLFELTWKTLWLLTIALPLWRAGQVDAGTAESVFACGLGLVVFPIAIPWRYVWRHYVLGPGDRWR